MKQLENMFSSISMNKFSSRQKQILEFILQKGPLSNQDILSEFNDISRTTVVRDLSVLLNLKLIQKIGQGRSVQYRDYAKNDCFRYIDPEKYFQKDAEKPGFRKGHVPLNTVEGMIQPSYLLLGMLEELVHVTVKKILDEKKDLKFIGQPYDFNPQQLAQAEKGNYTVTFKVDVYPEVTLKDDKWKKSTLKEVVVTITEEKQKEVYRTVERQ